MFVAQYVVHIIVCETLSDPVAVAATFSSCARYRSRGHQRNENIKRLACFWSVLREGLITTKYATQKERCEKSANKVRR